MELGKLPPKQYDRMIEYALRNRGPKGMIEDLEERNDARKALKLREQATRREAIVSNYFMSGLRGIGKDPNRGPGSFKAGFFGRVVARFKKLFEPSKPIAGNYSWTIRNGKKILLSWPSYLKPDELKKALKFYGCELESGI